MQQVLGRGGETRLKAKKEGGGNKRAGRRSDKADTKAVVQRTTRVYSDVAKRFPKRLRQALRRIAHPRESDRLNRVTGTFNCSSDKLQKYSYNITRTLFFFFLIFIRYTQYYTF